MEPQDIPHLILGALTAVRGEAKDAVDMLIKTGKKGTGDADKVLKKVSQRGASRTDELSKLVSQQVKKAFGTLGVITRSDLKKIEKKVQDLERQVKTTKSSAKKKTKQ